MSKCRYDLSEDCNNTDCLNCVLDKIRAENKKLREAWDKVKAEIKAIDDSDSYVRNSDYWDGFYTLTGIIDKYF